MRPKLRLTTHPVTPRKSRPCGSTLVTEERGLRRCAAEQTRDRSQSTSPIHRRVQHHALPRSIRPRSRSVVDNSTDEMVRRAPWNRREVRRTSSHLADRAACGLGGIGPHGSGTVHTRLRHAAASHRCDGLQLGVVETANGQSGCNGGLLPIDPTFAQSVGPESRQPNPADAVASKQFWTLNQLLVDRKLVAGESSLLYFGRFLVSIPPPTYRRAAT